MVKFVFCFLDIDDCIGVDCGPGTCVDALNNHTCKCPTTYAGPKCESKFYNFNSAVLILGENAFNAPLPLTSQSYE